MTEKHYKQVIVKTVDDLPKETGFYIFGWKNGTVMGMNYSKEDAIDTFNTASWFYQPIELPVKESIEPISDAEIREPIENALYATGNFNTGDCTDLAIGIIDYLKDAGFVIMHSQLQPLQVQEKEKYPVIAIEDIDAETVKRWFQLFMGFPDTLRMKEDIEAMARASYLNAHLNWEVQPEVSAEEILKPYIWTDTVDKRQYVSLSDALKAMERHAALKGK